MPDYSLPYGRGALTFELKTDQVDTILPPHTCGAADPINLVRAALDIPLGSVDYSRWEDAKSVVIAINDKTRPVPLKHLLPPLLEKLTELHIRDSAITFLIATGTHLPISQPEIAAYVPEGIFSKYRFISHDCDDQTNLTPLGRTVRGTPVWLNSIFMSANVRITLGDIEPHHFMGFSGGAKTAAIGLAGRETINANHAMLVDPLANIAVYAENPMRQDVEEIGDKIGIDLVLNPVLNESREIVDVFAGLPHQVMEAGIPRSLQICATQNSTKYDVVIASPGGYPKDINLYQSQKAISHAGLFTKPGGTIIVAAECIEGSGSVSFENFMSGLHSFSEVEEHFNNITFQIGPHKAYLIARQAANFNIFLHSSLPDEQVRTYLLNPVSDIGKLLETLLDDLPGGRRIAILPHATTTLPQFS